MILIVAPHADDEVLGCASFLGAGVPDRHGLSEGVAVLYVADFDHPEFEKELRAEFANLMRSVPVAPYFAGRFFTNSLVCAPPLITRCEEVLNEVRPSTVLVPAPSYNQDHRAVYDAMLTALRPHDRNWFVKRVLAYEEPETFGTLRKPDPFRPTYFRPLSVGSKLALYRIYESQVREHRSPEHIEAIAAVRGMQANMGAAEAFEVLRWVE